MTETMAIEAIRVADRHRKDLGDLSDLRASIESVGLLHPIVVTPDGRLVAGQRRLEALRQLGYSDVPVTVAVDLYDARLALFAERDENTARLDMTPSEKVALGRALEELERPKAEARMHQGRPPANGTSENFTEVRRGDTREIVGEAIGMSGPTYQRAKAVVIAAEEGDLIAQEAVREMDRTGKVTPAWVKVNGKPTKAPTAPPPEENGRYASARSVQRIAHQASALAMAIDALPLAKSCARLAEEERLEALQECKKGLKALNALANALGR